MTVRRHYKSNKDVISYNMKTMATAAEFYREWMIHTEWWMSATPAHDAYIVATYGHLLDEEAHEGIAGIIIYDQLPRHMFRNDTGAAHIISYFLRKALALVPTDTRGLWTVDWIFTMLPIRHSENVRAIMDRVLNEAWDRLEKEPVNLFLRRFIKATYERMPMSSESVSEYYYSSKKGSKIDYRRFTDVLEFAPQRGPDLNVATKENTEKYILSLSGGVDSMVASVLYNNVISAAVHINYMNRGIVSMKEEEFVREWCAYLGIPLYVRRIPEISRATAMKFGMRDLYESYTKRVRMTTYGDLPVILGHNADDCFENIMTNVAQQQKYENLCGMDERSQQFYRPLLKMPKSRIYDIAYERNIPFVFNSTPDWSQRGIIRDSVRPTLEKWDGRFIDGAFQLSKIMAAMTKMIEAFVATYITRTLMAPNKLLVVDKEEFATINNVVFWREYISQLTGGTIAPGAKALQQLCERCARFEDGKTSIPINKNVEIQIKTTRTNPTVLVITKFRHAVDPSPAND
jgi:tRNA(Ile)-lysidine synthase TilS/MesJ/uncharacterized protein (DUF924 family)